MMSVIKNKPRYALINPWGVLPVSLVARRFMKAKPLGPSFSSHV